MNFSSCLFWAGGRFFMEVRPACIRRPTTFSLVERSYFLCPLSLWRYFFRSWSCFSSPYVPDYPIFFFSPFPPFFVSSCTVCFPIVLLARFFDSGGGKDRAFCPSTRLFSPLFFFNDIRFSLALVFCCFPLHSLLRPCFSLNTLTAPAFAGFLSIFAAPCTVLFPSRLPYFSMSSSRVLLPGWLAGLLPASHPYPQLFNFQSHLQLLTFFFFFHRESPPALLVSPARTELSATEDTFLDFGIALLFVKPVPAVTSHFLNFSALLPNIPFFPWIASFFSPRYG